MCSPCNVYLGGSPRIESQVRLAARAIAVLLGRILSGSEKESIIRQEAWLDTTKLLILDELHKMPEWKNYLKGVYDTRPEHLMILVTGSARLEAFRHGGDSLTERKAE